MGNNNFTINFKKKRTPSDSISINAANYKAKREFCPKFFKIKKIEKTIKNAENFSDELDYDSRLVRKRYDHFFLCIPDKLDKYNGPSPNKVIAFDPRIRIFL